MRLADIMSSPVVSCRQTATVTDAARAMRENDIGFLVVTGDSGPMHLAAAVRTPVVALFGPTVEQFGFFPYKARATVLERTLACRPCSSKGGPRCPLGHHRCLTDILPEEVMARTLEWIE